MEPSSSREPPWAEHEKVYLLAEILKAAPIPSHVLFGIIRDANIQPRWNDMALPPGRSVRSSQIAFDSLAATYSAPGQEYRRPQLPAPMLYPGPDITRKRPLQPEASTPVGRLLQPRPPHSFPGEFMPAGPAYTSTINPSGEPANKKKRGRPTKAEAQQRAQEAAARGEFGPSATRSNTTTNSAFAAGSRNDTATPNRSGTRVRVLIRQEKTDKATTIGTRKTSRNQRNGVSARIWIRRS
ncbi:unnamed protein product [Alternaria alternata]